MCPGAGYMRLDRWSGHLFGLWIIPGKCIEHVLLYLTCTIDCMSVYNGSGSFWVIGDSNVYYLTGFYNKMQYTAWPELMWDWMAWVEMEWTCGPEEVWRGHGEVVKGCVGWCGVFGVSRTGHGRRGNSSGRLWRWILLWLVIRGGIIFIVGALLCIIITKHEPKYRHQSSDSNPSC